MNLPRVDNKNLHNETHIWVADLDQWNLSCFETVQALPETEAKKAGRFRFETHKNRFIKGRFMLRSLLGMYLDIDFYDQEFHANRYGKPAVHKVHDDKSIHFNISNSENIYVCAFSQNSDIGIDIEKIHDLPDMDRIMAASFSEEEIRKLNSLPEPNRRRTFFKYWARKEALLKAMGVGLSIPLDEVNILYADNDASRVFTKHNGTEWTLDDIDILDGFASALARKSKQCDDALKIRYYWPN